jgi:L-asparagine transporter-like permease
MIMSMTVTVIVTVIATVVIIAGPSVLVNTAYTDSRLIMQFISYRRVHETVVA